MVEILRVGDLVKSNREFSNVPKGTIGKCVDVESHHLRVTLAIEWQRPIDLERIRNGGKALIDWFSVEDLQYLDKVEQ